MRLPTGAHVQTLSDSGADDYSEPRKCQWGVPGIVIRYSDSHGLCYLVRHFDGSEAWYEPSELKEGWK